MSIILKNALRRVGIVTDTFYPHYGSDPADTLRGDLALRLVKSARTENFSTIIVDGGSDQKFLDKVAELGVTPIPQKEKGMSSGRQQGYAALFANPNMEFCVRLEAEKYSFIEQNCINECISAMLEDVRDTHLVIPARTEGGLRTYPPMQAESEKFANRMYCDALRYYGLLSENLDLDLFFGPRVFHRNALPYFMRRYAYVPSNSSTIRGIKPEAYSNALYFPVVNMLHQQKLTYATALVSYRHPLQQTALETGNADFDLKRTLQRRGIIAEHWEFLRLLYGQPSELRLAS